MKIAGKTPKRLFEDAFVVIDADGEEFPILIKTVDPFQFKTDYPEPEAPTKRVGDLTVANLKDAGYMANVARRESSFNDWIVLAAIRDTPGMEWDTVKMDDPSTWSNWRNDLKSIMVPAEINLLHSKILDLQGLDTSKVDAARKRFLASRAGAQDKL